MMGRFVFLPWGTADFTVKAAIKKRQPGGCLFDS